MHLKKKPKQTHDAAFLHNRNAAIIFNKIDNNLQHHPLTSPYSNFLTCPILPQLILLILEPVKDHMTPLFVLTLKPLSL